MRDVWLVAWFELFRAVRKWRAVALLVLYGVASGGAGYLFAQFVGLLERALAEQMNVAPSETPGAMIEDLLASDDLVEVLAAMTGSSDLATELLAIPLPALFFLWLGFLLVPFFAASASAECIATDTRTRAIRFELLRTSRLELVLGRFVGQLLLTAVASAVSAAAMWAVILWSMTGVSALPLAYWLCYYAVRTWFFAVPFVGLGVAASQWTTSSAWARVMAIGATAGSWVLYGIARWLEDDRLPWVADLLLQLLPQGWIRPMWSVGPGWLGAAVATTSLGLAAVSLGYVRFTRRDL